MSSSHTGIERRSSSTSTRQAATYKFPDLAQDHLSAYGEEEEEEEEEAVGLDGSPRPLPSLPNGLHSHERWLPRRESHNRWSNGGVPQQQQQPGSGGGRHGRQKSLTEAIRTVRGRKASVSQNAHEIAEALKAPVSPKLV
ncbi:hypothetical protein LTR66_010944, partial [Elasticomyces elasticus]